jgi:antitoxin component of MazEF toxin-antitoxin module
MVKKLSRHGNSFAIIIDKPILDLLQITDETELKLSTDGKTIHIEPIKKPSREKSKSAIYKGIKKKYSAVLEKLAKN